MSRNTSKRNSGVSLPVSRMALRLVPYVMRSDAEAGHEAPEVVLNYAANLDPLHDDTNIADLPSPPAVDLPGAQLQPLAFEIIVKPTIAKDGNGDEVLTFALEARLPRESAGDPHQFEPQDTLSPWVHDMSSDIVGECVARVRNAPPEDRYRRILELADAMMAPLDAKNR